MFKDEYGLPVTLEGDGGDTLQRCGAWTAGRASLGDRSVYWFARWAAAWCHLGRGVWVRHPGRGTPVFWSDPKKTSRDQILNAFVVARMGKLWSVLGWTTFKTLRRLGFAPNWTDHLIGQTSLIIRCWYPFSLVLWPLLVITDMALLLGALSEMWHWRWKHETMRFVRKSADDADVDNAVLQYWIAWQFMPTPISYLARHVHAFAMMETFGSKRFKVQNKLAGAMFWKHRPEAHGDQDLAEVWRPWLEEFTWTRKQASQ